MIYKTEPVKVFLNGKHSDIFTLIDTEDADLVNEYKWYLNTSGYAATTYHKLGCSKNGIDRNINQSLSRLLLNNPEGIVDHIDRNRLNNTKSNLRIVDYRHNNWNIKIERNPKTGYIGVYTNNDYTYYATVCGKTIGYYTSSELAAKARDLYLINERGLEYASINLNFDVTDLPLEVPAISCGKHFIDIADLRGVSFSSSRKAMKKWRVVFKKKHYGWFLTKEDATNTLITIKQDEIKKNRINRIAECC